MSRAQEVAVSSTCGYDSVLLLPSVRQSPVVVAVGCFNSSVVLNLVGALHTVCRVSLTGISLLVVFRYPLQHVCLTDVYSCSPFHWNGSCS